MRILVTGVSGFIGARLARALVDAGHRVAGTYIEDALRMEGVSLHRADLRDREMLAAALAESRPEVVVHLAGLSHVGASWRRSSDYFQVNVLGTENLLAAAGDARVVVASSSEVYGRVPEAEQPIAEDRPPAPRNPYALTKAAAERLALAAGASVVRSFNVVGPGQAAAFALPSFARQLAAIARGEVRAVLEVGNLEPRRDFLHVDDAADAYALLVERGRPGEIYNLGSGRARRVGEMLERLIGISGLEVEVRVDPERCRTDDLPLLLADCGRLRALGWEPRRPLDDALAGLWRQVGGEPASPG